MHEMEVYCANEDECTELLKLEIESEDMGEGSEHEVKCDSCGKTTVFNIAYMPVTDDEKIKE